MGAGDFDNFRRGEPLQIQGISSTGFDHFRRGEPFSGILQGRDPGYYRIVGPLPLAGSASTLYRVPEQRVTRILATHASNPSGSPVDINISIGTDAAGTRIYDDYEIAADSIDGNFDAYDLAAGETIQGWAGTAATVVLTITAWEKSI